MYCVWLFYHFQLTNSNLIYYSFGRQSIQAFNIAIYRNNIMISAFAFSCWKQTLPWTSCFSSIHFFSSLLYTFLFIYLKAKLKYNENVFSLPFPMWIKKYALLWMETYSSSTMWYQLFLKFWLVHTWIFLTTSSMCWNSPWKCKPVKQNLRQKADVNLLSRQPLKPCQNGRKRLETSL